MCWCKKLVKSRVITASLFFSEFFCNTKTVIWGYYVFKLLMGLYFPLKMLASYLISDLRWHTHKIRNPSLGKGHVSSSQPRPCWAVEALPLRRCEFWCPPRYSNWEILGNFIWSCNSCWGQLDTWKIWPFVPKWGGQRGGRWEFASYVLGASFILS